MEIITLCKKLGISKNAAATYLALLADGQASVAPLARNAKLARPLIYRILPELMSLGLVARVRKGKREEYVAMSPERLLALHKKLGDDLTESLPTLSHRYEKTKRTSTIRQLDGKVGIQAVYDDIVATLPDGATFYRYSSSKAARKRDEYVPKDYTKRRDAKNLERFVITNKENARRKGSKLERAIKTVPVDAHLFSYDITEIIYGNKLAFVDYGKETAMIIENKEIAEFQTRLFKLLYQRL